MFITNTLCFVLQRKQTAEGALQDTNSNGNHNDESKQVSIITPIGLYET